MSNLVNWQNPYAQRDGVWLRGNLHTHSLPASGCARIPLAEMLDLYAAADYDFLSMSEHMGATHPVDDRLLFIPGIEWNSPTGNHTGIYGTYAAAHPELCTLTSQDELLAAMDGQQGLVILNHPNWQYRPHYHREELLEAGPYDGIEIFNGVIQVLEGCEYATDKWDYLLAHGRRVLGFASDDAHWAENVGCGWIMVRSSERTPEAILHAIQMGNFYASSGVTLRDIRRDGNTLTLESEDAQEIHVIGEGGRLLKKVHDHSTAHSFADNESAYLRFTAYGHGAAMAWSQAFFR